MKARCRHAPFVYIILFLLIGTACTPGNPPTVPTAPIPSPSSTAPRGTTAIVPPAVTHTPTYAPISTRPATVASASTRLQTAPIPSATQSPLSTGWVAGRGGPDSSGANLNTQLRLPLKLTWEWQASAQGGRAQAVAIANDQVFALMGRGELCVLNARTGVKQICQPIWEDPKGSTSGGVTVTLDRVIVNALEVYIKPGDKYGSGRSRLAVFTLEGKPLWSSRPADRGYTTALVPGDNLVISLDESAPAKFIVNALDLKNGATRWTSQAFFGFGASDGTFFYADEGDGGTSAFRVSTGQRAWHQPVEAGHVLYSQGRVFALGDKAVTALDAASGKVIWQAKFGVFPVDQAVAAHGHLYVEPKGGETARGYGAGIMAMDVASGKEVWSALTGEEWIDGPIAATADALVAIGQNRNQDFQYQLLILDPVTGAEKQRVALGKESVRGIAVAGEQVYILSDMLRVYGPSQPGK